MGNSSSKHDGSSSRAPVVAPGDDPNPPLRPQQPSSSSRARNRGSRADFSLLTGFTPPRPGGTQQAQPEHRRETRQEREARRLEKERIAREKERERSMREEHVDGGYLVTMGIYKGREDFNKAIVRQLQIERKLAPFWRPLEVDVDDLTDAQLVAVARGLPVPDADAPLPPDLLSVPPTPISPDQSTQNLGLPHPPTQASQASQSQTGTSEPGPTSGLPSPVTPSQPRRSRGKAIAEALSLRSSRNNSQTDLCPREITLPQDPFVNGQPLEVVLYRSSEDCPICFATYPNHLNHTRCCDNLICSECFVQIKRPDPHVPEGHGEPLPEDPEQAAAETHNRLVSEPAACPYCTQPEFGVTYEPPAFRRGLVYAATFPNFVSSAMSSQSSLSSHLGPVSPTSPGHPGGRRRTHSLSANAPNVVTTDKIRPDWSVKLAAMRTTQARRAAAATALHQAAFMMYSPERQMSFGRAQRFIRRNGADSASAAGGSAQGQRTAEADQDSRLQHFEEVMMAEAIRLSLAAEEERRRKEEREAEKQAKKEAKKREKEERKAAKVRRQTGSFYADGQASGSRSSVSLGLGRRRGNSGASSLRMELTPEHENEDDTAEGAGGAQVAAGPSSPTDNKGKAVDRGDAQGSRSSAAPSASIAIPQQIGHHGPSHLRQTSNISSLSSSLAESQPGSYAGQGFASKDAANPRASGISLASGDSGSGATESMFNFTSMASRMGINLDERETAADDTVSPQGSQAQDEDATQVGDEGPVTQTTTQATDDDTVAGSVVTLQPSGKEDDKDNEAGDERLPDDKAFVAPEVRLIPGSPLPVSDDAEFSKDIGRDSSAAQRTGEIA